MKSDASGYDVVVRLGGDRDFSVRVGSGAAAYRRRRRRLLSALAGVLAGSCAVVFGLVALVDGEFLDGPRRGRSPRAAEAAAGAPPLELDRVRRVSIVGPAGSGKTALAGIFQQSLHLPYVKVDNLQRGPDGFAASQDEFRARMGAAATAPAWVMDGNVTIAGTYWAVDEVWTESDLVVWLDLPRALVMKRLLTRTAIRAYHHTELRGGVTQRWRDLFVWDASRSVLAWTWVEQPVLHDVYRQLARDPRWSERVRRLTTTGQVRAVASAVHRAARREP